MNDLFNPDTPLLGSKIADFQGIVSAVPVEVRTIGPHRLYLGDAYAIRPTLGWFDPDDFPFGPSARGAMGLWFLKTHGEGTFNGVLIKWEPAP